MEGAGIILKLGGINNEFIFHRKKAQRTSNICIHNSKSGREEAPKRWGTAIRPSSLQSQQLPVLDIVPCLIAVSVMFWKECVWGLGHFVSWMFCCSDCEVFKSTSYWPGFFNRYHGSLTQAVSKASVLHTINSVDLQKRFILSGPGHWPDANKGSLTRILSNYLQGNIFCGCCSKESSVISSIFKMVLPCFESQKILIIKIALKS